MCCWAEAWTNRLIAYNGSLRFWPNTPGSIRILHRLTPLGIALAGANEFNPYKD
jgi:hypothetical protein